MCPCRKCATLPRQGIFLSSKIIALCKKEKLEPGHAEPELENLKREIYFMTFFYINIFLFCVCPLLSTNVYAAMWREYQHIPESLEISCLNTMCASKGQKSIATCFSCLTQNDVCVRWSVPAVHLKSELALEVFCNRGCRGCTLCRKPLRLGLIHCKHVRNKTSISKRKKEVYVPQVCLFFLFLQSSQICS